MFKIPQNNEKYHWTLHVIEKMKYYGISPGRVQRVIRAPERTEEGVAPNTIASMQKVGNKKQQEIWVMYQTSSSGNKKSGKFKLPGKIKIITAWRFPGESPKRDPIPKDIIEEVRNIL